MAQAQAQAQAQQGPLKIGITEGFSGVYADLNLGEVEAAQMAIDDFGGKVLGRPIELLSADHQTKPDVGAQIARRWYDVDGVSMITGIGTSSVALAVRKIAQEKGLIDINTGAASAAWVPVQRDGHSVGVLAVGWTDRRGELSERDSELLRLLAAEAAITIHRTDLLARLQSTARTDAPCAPTR